MVIFTLCVAQLRSGALVWPVAVLAVGVFLAATCAIMAVLPSVGRSRGDVGTDDNLLFFGIFTSLSEAEFSDRMMALVSDDDALRSEEHTSELQSLMRISYAVFCLKKNI